MPDRPCRLNIGWKFILNIIKFISSFAYVTYGANMCCFYEDKIKKINRYIK